ncbi:MAG TPA: SRPBCC family protein [Streptosporangiaceae bacterium]
MKRSFHIEAPVETVFEYLKDPTNDQDFLGYQIDDIKVTKEGVGTYYSWHAKIAGMPLRGFEVVTEFNPNKHVTERSSNPMVGTWSYDLEPEGSGTKLTMEHKLDSFWRLPPLRNLIDLFTERMSGVYMRRVRKAIETPAS